MLRMKNTRVGQILNNLMAEKKIRVAELARRVNLPQPTVHRIVSGVCEHPHFSSLKPIADFFSLSVAQIKGHEPIQWLDHIVKVPLLAWEQLASWLTSANTSQPIEIHQKVITDATVGPRAFALKVKDASMDPVFPKNTLLIADPEREVRDRSYVLAQLANHPEPIFRQLLINAADRYLKPLSPDLECYKMIKLNNNDNVLSAIIQAKRDCEDYS
jgi:SOS-response transcriptional repressor LexA